MSCQYKCNAKFYQYIATMCIFDISEILIACRNSHFEWKFKLKKIDFIIIPLHGCVQYLYRYKIIKDQHIHLYTVCIFGVSFFCKCFKTSFKTNNENIS